MKTKRAGKILAFILALTFVFTTAAVAVSAEGEIIEGGMIFREVVGDPTKVILSSVEDEKYEFYNLEIPNEISGKQVVAIADYAFMNCVYLTDVSIPLYVTEIGAQAFDGCYNLSGVKFWGEVERVGENAFRETPWFDNYPTDFVYASTPHGMNLLIGYKNTNPETSKNIVIPMTVDAIADGAFAGNANIESVTLPVRTVKIGARAFADCVNLKDVIVESTLEKVGADAFTNTAWLNNYQGDYVVLGTFFIKYNGNDDFVLIPNTVTDIADYAFAGCMSVVAVRVPASIDNFGDECFYIFNDNTNTKYAEIYCWDGTPIAEYAKNNELQTADYLYLPGDVNGDGKVKANDARLALRIAAKLEDEYTKQQLIAADIDCDLNVEPSDARIILRMAAEVNAYTPHDLLFKPNTDFEILMAYANAIRLAVRKQAGYSMKSFQTIDEVEVGPAWFRTFLCNPFKTELTKEKKAKTVAVAKDTLAAIEKLYACDLANERIIKSASCVMSDSQAYYYLTIELYDELDVVGTDSYTSKMFPVISTEDIENTLMAEESIWYDNCLTDFHYTVTYRNCKLSATTIVKDDATSGRAEAITMNMGYKFDMWGKVNGIEIYLRDHCKTPVGYVTRTDTVVYSDFDYTPSIVE